MPSTPLPSSVVGPSLRPSAVRSGVDRGRTFVNDRWQQLTGRHPQLLLVEAFARRWIGVNATVLAGHLAYRVFFFLVPLALLLVGGLGVASSSGVDLEDGSTRLRLSRALAAVIADAGEQAKSSHVQLVILGAFGTLVACLGLLKALQIVFATAWGMAPPKGRRLALLWRLLLGVVILLGAMALRQWLSRSNIVISLGSIVAALAINVGLIAGLSWLLPRRTQRLIDLLPGTVLGGLAFGGLNIVGVLYFPDKAARVSALYGSFGIALVLLLYFFLVGQVLVASAVANSVWFDRERILRGEAP